MRKSTLFISAILTTFMLAVLFGVVSQYKKIETAVQTQEPVVVEALPTAAELPAATQATMLTPEQAAQLAAQILGRTDLLSVETSAFNTESAYLVKFTNGDQVFVSPAGMILSVVQAPPQVVVVSGGSSSKNNDRPRAPRPGGGGGGGDDDGDDD